LEDSNACKCPVRSEGSWQGRQVVSADWIRESVTPHMTTDRTEKYGYLWWLTEFPGREGPEPMILEIPAQYL